NAGVGGVCIEVGGFEHRDAAPGGDGGRSDIVPGFAVVGRELDEAVVGTDPEEGGVEGRGGNGVDDAAFAVAGDLRGGGGVEVGGDAGIGAREIGADLDPGAGAVGGFEEELVGVVE